MILYKFRLQAIATPIAPCTSLSHYCNVTLPTKRMAVASAVRCRTVEAAFRRVEVNDAESFTTALSRARTSNSCIEDASANRTATFVSGKRRIMRSSLLKELEVLTNEEGISVTRGTQTTGRASSGAKSLRLPTISTCQEGCLREAAKQLAMATRKCDDYMLKVTANQC